MAREIVVWCDPCMREDQRTPGREVTLTIGPDKPKIVAMCPEHEDSLVKPLQAIIEEFGEVVEAVPGVRSGGPKGPRGASLLAERKRHGYPPSGGRPNQCLWCDLSYSASGGFPRHLKIEHGFDGLVEAFGGPCPVCGEGPYEQMMNHCNRAHPEMGFKHITAPYEWARDNGDPFGIYAAKLEQKGSLDPAKAFEEVRAAESRKPKKK